MAQAATQPAGTGRAAPRRRAIIDATIRILRSEGPGGVTHRILAQELGRDELPAIAAAGLTASMRAEYEITLPKFEIYLEAARRPSLRPCAERWIDAFHGVAEA